MICADSYDLFNVSNNILALLLPFIHRDIIAHQRFSILSSVDDNRRHLQFIILPLECIDLPVFYDDSCAHIALLQVDSDVQVVGIYTLCSLHDESATIPDKRLLRKFQVVYTLAEL